MSSINVKTNIFKNIRKQMKELSDHELEYGVFSDAGIHRDSGLPMATILSFSELSNDPETKRPVLEISSEENKESYSDMLTKSITKSLIDSSRSGRITSSKNIYNQIGEHAVIETKKIFGDTSKLKSNSPSTIQQKGANSPLIEFGDLKNSIDFKIKPRPLNER